MAIKFGRPLERGRPFPGRGGSSPAERLDLAIRPRRNRRAEWARRMVREHVLTTDDLIWPLFLVEGTKVRAPVASMPDVERLSVDEAVRAAERAAKLTIPCLALFPYTDPGKRDETGSEALNAENLVCRAIRAIKKEVPDIGVLCDVALDPYTSHGHDGLLRDGVILNDETVAVLVRQALVQAEAGCDIIAPSDMMDGRVGAIRAGLDAAGYHDVQIMAYAAKYASAFYGPFRDAVGSSATLTGDKRTYQMDPANTDEALREVELDIAEGADMVMVKPGLPYLDILQRVKERLRHAHLCLSSVRRICDDHGRRGERLARRGQGNDGKLDRLQARRRRRRADLFRGKDCGETEEGRRVRMIPKGRPGVAGGRMRIRKIMRKLSDNVPPGVTRRRMSCASTTTSSAVRGAAPDHHRGGGADRRAGGVVDCHRLSCAAYVGPPKIPTFRQLACNRATRKRRRRRPQARTAAERVPIGALHKLNLPIRVHRSTLKHGRAATDDGDANRLPSKGSLLAR